MKFLKTFAATLGVVMVASSASAYKCDSVAYPADTVDLAYATGAVKTAFIWMNKESDAYKNLASIKQGVFVNAAFGVCVEEPSIDLSMAVAIAMKREHERAEAAR